MDIRAILSAVAPEGDILPLLLGLIFVAVFLALMAASGLLGPQNRVERRIGGEVTARSASRRPPEKLRLGSSSKASSVARVIEVLHKHAKADKEGRSRVRLRLMQAGYMSPSAFGTYYAIRFLLAVGLPVAFGVLTPFVARHMSFEEVVIVSVILCVLGLGLPTVWIILRVSSRQTAARNGFPDALDMLLVCVEAGLSLDAALNRVATEIGPAHPLLGEQFALVALELRAGQSRELALRNLADRLGIQEAASLVTLLVQTEQLGTSVAQTLRVHAAEIRSKRMLRAEEKANMIPVKLSIPLVLFLLPCLMLVILAPALISIIRVLLPTMEGMR